MADEVQNKRDIVSITRELLQESQKLLEVDSERFKQNQSIQDTLEDIVKAQGDSNKLSNISSDLEDQLVMAKQEGNTELVKEIGLLQQVIKVKKKEAEAQDNINKAYRDLGEKLGLGGLIGTVDAFREASEKAGSAMVIRLMAAGLVLGGLITLFSSIANLTDQVGERFGAIGVTEFGKELSDAGATATRLGFSFDDMAGSVEELSSNFGVSFDDAIGISESTMDTARALGISAKESAQLTGILMTMAGLSADTAQNFLKQTAALAKSAGVAPAAVMSDIAGSSADIAGFMKDGGDNIAQAAVKARTLGINIGDVSKAARGMLEFQSSIKDEMTASVMIGRQLNFQKARELALAGDLENFQNEILRQVGDESEFLSLNVLQREALAKAAGFELDSLTKLVSEQGKSVEQLSRMRELSVEEIVSSNALSNITQATNALKAFGTNILAAISYLGTFNGTLEGTGAIIGTVLTVALAAALGYFLFLGAKMLIASAALKLFGTTAATVGPQLGSFGITALPALFILGAIALVGATLVGVFYALGYILQQLPPVIDSLAAGFATIADSVVNGIIALANPAIILGIFGLAAAFYYLGLSLMSVAAFGTSALMPMLAILGFIGGLAALGFTAENIIRLVHGPESMPAPPKEDDPVLVKLDAIKSSIDDLVTGFGRNGVAGEYITNFGNAVPRTVTLAKS